MGIWSRRLLSRMIVHNASVLGREGALRHAHLLNAWNEDTISTQWEVAILYGLSFLGKVEHEVATESGVRLDAIFHSFGGSVSFAADIVAVNDSGLEAENPLRRFEAELQRRACKAGITTEGFHVEVGGRQQAHSRGRRTSLALPPRSTLHSIFDSAFDSFLQRVRDSPDVATQFAKQAGGVDVLITYTPGQRGSSARYAGYRWPQSLTRNPLYHALDRKAAQLKRAGTGLPRVIFACDGGSESLRFRQSPIPGVFPPSEIIARFFRDHTVTAVCIVAITRDATRRQGRDDYRLQTKLFTHPAVAAAEIAALSRLLNQLPTCIPQPRYDIPNALVRLSPSLRHARPDIGGTTLSSDYVKISARAMQEFLSGKISQDQFLKQHYFVPATPESFGFNPFAQALEDGRLIDRVTVEKCPDSDDDWLIFHFAGQDPAIAPFRIP